MNIPGLDAPSWSRVSGTDEAQEAEEELIEEARWKASVDSGAEQGLMYTPAQGAAEVTAAAPIACDLLVIACGMMSSAYLSTLLEGVDGSGASSALRELGRFTLPAASVSSPTPAPLPSDLAVGSSAAKAARLEAQRPYALELSALGSDSSTLIARSFLRLTPAQFFPATQALFARVAPKRVLLLDTLAMGAFLSAQRPVPCPPLLRSLRSTAAVAAETAAASAAASAAAASVPTLEAPNLVTSFSAAVLSHCEFARLPATLYISVESRHYVLETLHAFEALWADQAASSAPLSAAVTAFASAGESRRRAAYRAWVARLSSVYAYSAGQDSSMRETAGEVQRDHMAEMFY